MQYPADDLDRIDKVLRILSSYWTRTYGGQDQVRSVQESNLLQLRDLRRLQSDSEKTLSRFETPPFRRSFWSILTILQSDRNANGTATALYGENYVFGNDLIFGAARPSLTTSAYPIAENLVGIGLVTDRLENPGVVLFPEMDYVIDRTRGAVVFAADPFADSRWVQTAIFEEGVVVDYAINLCLKSVDYDEQWLRKLWGYVIEVYEDSSVAYRKLLNAVFDAIVGGGVASPVHALLELTTGIPLSKDHETVEIIGSDAESNIIVTDKNAYRFSFELDAAVVVGDVLRPGAALTNGLQLYYFRNGVVPAEIKALTLDRSFIKVPGVDALVFINEDTPLLVDDEHESGRTYVSYTLGGPAEEAAAFFDNCHARGIADGTTLAGYLDIREDPTDEPTAASLPATINPLRFAAQNWLRNNVAVARIVLKGMGRNALGLETLRLLPELLPPRASLIPLAEWTMSEDTATAEDDALSFGYGWESQTDSGSLFDGGLKFTIASGECT